MAEKQISNRLVIFLKPSESKKIEELRRTESRSSLGKRVIRAWLKEAKN